MFAFPLILLLKIHVVNLKNKYVVFAKKIGDSIGLSKIKYS